MLDYLLFVTQIPLREFVYREDYTYVMKQFALKTFQAGAILWGVLLFVVILTNILTLTASGLGFLLLLVALPLGGLGVLVLFLSGLLYVLYRARGGLLSKKEARPFYLSVLLAIATFALHYAASVLTATYFY
jgi:hypothetical protein